ncbi:DNA-processing protein DprA [Rhodococcus sp. IEGM 1330]|uniref:DNA-processing protein DprA n=1 Tax=Rhodococcus sp. IEGM 1330 TaxID=3082225 RepID=UPI00295337A1|nr:DNA-processing protein DprA [Rhodococcus sp. IEGM 1330]MDV8024953.1 DNA-processing protein DprA [Rhodococcus sp. IEGM 1330]
MGDISAEETVALLALLSERPLKMTWPAIASEVALRGSAVDIWNEIHPPTFDGMNDEDGYLSVAKDQLRSWEHSGFDLLTVLDDRYPASLREIHELPPLLFMRGKVHYDEVGVSVVGSRNASDRGIAIAQNIAGGLVDRGISVISGLAVGIDTAAHLATLAAGGRPVGVIGTGINLAFPAANRDLHDRVADAGALISQFFPDAPPRRQHFPMRNAVMSGIGRASIVVEAGEHSGARIQARLAVEHGRPVILTDLVVGATNWGKALVGRPGVHVAGSIAEAMAVVEDVVSTASYIDDQLPVLSLDR